jgi:hypothetical protein
MGHRLMIVIIFYCGAQQSRVNGDDSTIYPGFALNLFWPCSLFAVWSVRHVRCMGSSDRAFVIRIVVMMVGNTTPLE